MRLQQGLALRIVRASEPVVVPRSLPEGPAQGLVIEQGGEVEERSRR